MKRLGYRSVLFTFNRINSVNRFDCAEVKHAVEVLSGEQCNTITI